MEPTNQRVGNLEVSKIQTSPRQVSKDLRTEQLTLVADVKVECEDSSGMESTETFEQEEVLKTEIEFVEKETRDLIEPSVSSDQSLKSSKVRTLPLDVDRIKKESDEDISEMELVETFEHEEVLKSEIELFKNESLHLIQPLICCEQISQPSKIQTSPVYVDSIKKERQDWSAMESIENLDQGEGITTEIYYFENFLATDKKYPTAQIGSFPQVKAEDYTLLPDIKIDCDEYNELKSFVHEEKIKSEIEIFETESLHLIPA